MCGISEQIIKGLADCDIDYDAEVTLSSESVRVEANFVGIGTIVKFFSIESLALTNADISYVVRRSFEREIRKYRNS